MPSKLIEDLEESPAGKLRLGLEDGTALIGVIGLGYIGLPLALTFAQHFRVLGFDVDEVKTALLSDGQFSAPSLNRNELLLLTASGRFAATCDFTRLIEPDALLICVPTPLTRQREPDMSYVLEAGRQIQKRLRPGQLVILESTTYPGTTDELLFDLLKETGLVCGKDFFLAFSPERQDPGNPDRTVSFVPKLVAGIDDTSAELAEALYRRIVPKIIKVSSTRTAEAAKLTENIFRAVNIALVNELKIIYDRMGIDIWEVLDAASTKPFGFMRFDPGPGWGGHCIPLDPFYLAWKAREVGQPTGFIELAGHINARMRDFVLEKLTMALSERGKSVNKSAVLVLGLAYKRDVDDLRESPALEIIDRLIHLGAIVAYHDPHIPYIPRMYSWPQLPALSSVPLEPSRLAATDAVLVLTDHSDCDYDLVLAYAPLIVDTRGVYRERSCKVIKA